ncbi:DUF4830 domain-containing protein [Caldalkalibacillus salinus]|uniref:DUF4830 domain-containing protein n=1 Tax=Caldalkalibacillus salinus TaxID=2803787 RepID=UPI0019218775|nr:DUF4830 domain-containing protein [Caldalkalibacillus salinus]
MNKILFYGILLIFFLAGCSHTNKNELNEIVINENVFSEHSQFFSNYGWHIKTPYSEKTEIINYYPERIESLKLSGLDLEQYKGKEVKTTSYVLEEEQINGDKVYVTIYEIDGEIIGGTGALENWTPGGFSLNDKKRLIEDKVISE